MCHFLLISSYQVLGFLIFFMALLIFSLILAFKTETKFNFLVWTLIIVFIPFLGSLSYLLNYFISQKLEQRKSTN